MKKAEDPLTDVDMLRRRHELVKTIKSRVLALRGAKGVVKLLEAEIAKHEVEAVHTLESKPNMKVEVMKEHIEKTEALVPKVDAATKQTIKQREADFDDLNEAWLELESSGKEALDALSYLTDIERRDTRLGLMKRRYQVTKLTASFTGNGWPGASAKLIASRINQGDGQTVESIDQDDFALDKVHLFAKDGAFGKAIEKYHEDVIAPLVEGKIQAAGALLQQRMKWPSVMSKLLGASQPGKKFPITVENWNDGVVPWMLLARPNAFMWGPNHLPLPGTGPCCARSRHLLCW